MGTELRLWGMESDIDGAEDALFSSFPILAAGGRYLVARTPGWTATSSVTEVADPSRIGTRIEADLGVPEPGDLGAVAGPLMCENLAALSIPLGPGWETAPSGFAFRLMPHEGFDALNASVGWRAVAAFDVEAGRSRWSADVLRRAARVIAGNAAIDDRDRYLRCYLCAKRLGHLGEASSWLSIASASLSCDPARLDAEAEALWSGLEGRR